MNPRYIIAISIIIIIGWLIYQPGLSGGYIFDDFNNIVHNKILHDIENNNASIWRSWEAGKAGTGRPLSMFSFALNVKATGFDPYYFKVTNVLIHIINAVVIFWLTMVLLRLYYDTQTSQYSFYSIYVAAILTALFWLSHPVNLTSVLYVVQRMNSLSALFVFTGMAVYGYLRYIEFQSDKKIKTSYKVSLVSAFTLLATLCKENGILLPIYILLIEGSIIYNKKLPLVKELRLVSKIILIALLIASISIVILYELGYLSGYSNREFTLVERLLTQARVMFFYIYILLIPNEYNINLYYDNFTISRGMLRPLTTLPAVIGICVAPVVCYLLRNKYPVMVFGVGMFLVAHLIESTIIPLELVFLHRNYIPSYGIVLVIITSLLFILPKRLAVMGLPIACVVIASSSMATYALSKTWADPLKFSYSELLNNPGSARAHYNIARYMATLYVHDDLIDWSEMDIEKQDLLIASIDHFQKAADQNAQSLQPLFSLVMVAAQNNMDIKEEWIQAIEYRSANKPFIPGDGESFRRLIRCIERGDCAIEKLYMRRIIRALKRNPAIESKNGKVMNELADHYNNLSHPDL